MPTKDVNKLLKGVNDCILAAVDDAGAVSPSQVGDTFPLLSCGFLDENAIQSESKKLTQKEHGGNLLQLGEIASVNINSISGAASGITAAKLFKNAQCNIYGFGSQQSHKLTKFLMNVETPNELKKNGKSVIQFTTEKKVSPDETLGTLGSSATAFSTDSAYKYKEIIRQIRQQDLVFCVLPYLGSFGQTTKLYDASDNRVTGSLINGPAWGAAPDAINSKLTFDGVNDYADFGNLSIFSDVGLPDYMLEFWISPKAADGAFIYPYSKKSVFGDTTAGIGLYRNGVNNFTFRMADGTNSKECGAIPALQNVWVHAVCTLDRDGSMKTYKNGVLTETSTTISAIGSIANSVSMYLGRSSSNYGNVDLGAFRVYNFGAGGLPSNIATIIADHYNAEKAIFGL
ncbi:MAG: LamG domain-containing protein [Bacteroidetes bacterium]|nr:LamG domain-containing protein [Bacteroidota bacterium]